MGRYPSCTDCCTVYRMARRLGPLLFNLYTADIGMIVESHGHRLHQYADDCQVTEAAAAVNRFSCCVADVSTWLSSSCLRLNPAKTVVIWLGGRQQVANITVDNIPVLTSMVTTVASARDLSVIVDSQLTMSANVSSTC